MIRPSFIIVNMKLDLCICRSNCFCGEDPGSQSNEELCEYDCKGDPNYKCGSVPNDFYKSVYGTGRLEFSTINASSNLMVLL